MTSSAGSANFPPALKAFVNRTFAEVANHPNKDKVNSEMKTLIFDAFKSDSIDKIDWDNVQLESLKKKPTKAKPNKRKKSPTRSSSSSHTSFFHTGDSFDDIERRQKRAKRFERDQEEESLGDTGTLADRLGATKLSSGMASGSWRARDASVGTEEGYGPTFDPNVIDWDKHTIVGTSTKLEKPFLRLTDVPDPKLVRPLPVLKQTLELLKKKWRQEGNYAYICDQFKSMRQDLTVQRIKNDFTVSVYEIHARVALEKGDLGEYNQCQSQLRQLYAYNIPGHPMEFLAYRILYLLHTRNRRDVNALMAELTAADKANPAVAHALKTRSALATNNYHLFFQLFNSAPNMGGYLMDHFIERERLNALMIMAKAYRPHLSLSFITRELAFEDAAEADRFLREHNAAFYVDPTPAQAASAGANTTQNKKFKKVAKIPYEQKLWNGQAAMAGLRDAAEKYRKVDIKGQI